MTPLLQRLREIKAKRGLAFVPYLIPGAPSAEAYAQCMKILSRFGADLYETTIPVSEGWSEHTNETIKSFHRSSRLKLVDSIGVMAESVRSLPRDAEGRRFPPTPGENGGAGRLSHS